MILRWNKPGAEGVYLALSAAGSLFNATMFVTYTVFYVNRVHLDPLQLVLVGTLLEGTALVFEIPTGLVADTVSRRWSVIVGTLLLGAAFALMGALPTVGVVMLGQVISGIGYTFLSGATDAWLADEAGEDQLARIYLRSGQINRVMGILGAGVSVGLASLSLSLPFLCGGLGYLALGLALIFSMPENNFHPLPGKGRSTWETMQETLRQGAGLVRRSPVLLTLVWVSLVSGAASEGFDRLSGAHLLQNFTFPALGALQPVVWFGILDVGAGAFSLLTTALLRRRMEFASRSPRSTAKVLLALNLVSAAGVVSFALAGSFPLAVAALFVKAAVGAVSVPLYTAWLAQNIQPEVRATVLSMASQADALGQVAGGPGIGVLGKYISLRAALLGAGLLLTPVSALYGMTLRARVFARNLGDTLAKNL